MDIFGGELVRTTDDEDLLILDAIVRLYCARLNATDLKIIDRIIKRFVESGKHITEPLLKNLNGMLRLRRMQKVDLFYGPSDPSFGPERAKRRTDMLAALLDEPDDLVTDSGVWTKPAHPIDESVWVLCD